MIFPLLLSNASAGGGRDASAHPVRPPRTIRTCLTSLSALSLNELSEIARAARLPPSVALRDGGHVPTLVALQILSVRLSTPSTLAFIAHIYRTNITFDDVTGPVDYGSSRRLNRPYAA